ncbi:MAG: TonB-dependent receptor [Acidobacteria bacterium]|nr:TonB-dependent receptor [Acidobacteriota bacterium]MCI0723302.1 TonB-dependent receptor [Acidobacteriota bacterium]
MHALRQVGQRSPLWRLGLSISFLFLLAPVVLQAQEFRGTILGSITDPSGAAVAGAAIEAINIDTNVVVRSTSNEVGNYQVPFLIPGNYTVRVEQSGFKKIERQGIRVSTNAQVTLDFSLQIGETSDSVTVSADAPLLNTANADLSHVVENVLVRHLDLSFNRNVATLVHFTPGVTGVAGGTYTSGTQAQISINGGGSKVGANEYVVDGISNTAQGQPVFIPSLDSVEEFKVHTTMFDATLGHSNGGVISMTTRGGTNDLHGSAYFYRRPVGLAANGWTNNKFGQPRRPSRYHQYGYTVGGPVWIPRLYDGHNRTFFFTAFERDNDPRILSAQTRVPTELERQGDFSQTLNRLGGPFAIYDPATTVVSGATATRQPFAGARIPASRLSPIGVAVLKQFPLPNVAGPAQIGGINWVLNGTYTVVQSQVSGRIDHTLSDRHRILVRLGYLTRKQDSEDPFPAYLGRDIGHNLNRFINFGVEDAITFSPRLVGSIRLGVLRNDLTGRSGGAGFDPAKLQLPDSLVRNQSFTGWPGINLGEGIAGFGSGQNAQGRTQYSLLTTFTKLSGQHTTKFGVDYRWYRLNRNFPGASAFGAFSFNSVFTRSDPFTNTSSDTSGTAMASLLLGLPAGGSLGFVSPVSLQNHYLALFVQNDWKITPRLTLNLGLRYDLETPFTERYNRISYGFDPQAKLPVQAPGLDLRGGVLFAGVDGNPRRGGRVDTNNFAPRFGFAFQVLPKTVIRGGFGIFYSVQADNNGFFGANGVFDAVTPFIGTIDNGATPFNTLANPFPAGLPQPPGSSAGLLARVGDDLSYWDFSRVNPYSEQWQLSIQRELPSRMLLEAAYVGMHSLKQIENFNLNEKPDQFLALGAQENTRVPNPFLGVFPATSVLGQGSTITQNRLWVRYPQFTSLTDVGAPVGAAMYHALQVKLEKRITHGLTVLVPYTFSKLMDNNITSLVNPRHYRTVSSLDQRHVFRPTFVYEFPFRFTGQGWGKFLQQALGGWELAGYYTVRTGLPLSVIHANGRPIRIRNPKLSGPVKERLGDRRDPVTGRVLNPYFDINAFQPLPNQYTVTPEPPVLDELRAPTEKNLNLSLFKVFAIRERLKLQFNMEMDGVFNSPIFNAPGTNMSSLATFGVINSAFGSRFVQMSVRLLF